MERKFEILTDAMFLAYCKEVGTNLLNQCHLLEDSSLSIETFSFYTSVSAVFSSKIEGEPMELDSYIKHKRFGVEFLPDYTRKIDDLYSAYQFAKGNVCNRGNIEKAHEILTENVLPKNKQGKIRGGNMYVTTDDGRIEYVAASPYALAVELDKFYSDLETLLVSDLSIHEVFYYSSLLHLVFAKIHPFDDGNGRTSRLVEKWFLASKIGVKGWLVQSERNYYSHHQTYYQNIRLLGFEYENLDYSKSLPFLTMLPKALIIPED